MPFTLDTCHRGLELFQPAAAGEGSRHGLKRLQSRCRLRGRHYDSWQVYIRVTRRASPCSGRGHRWRRGTYPDRNVGNNRPGAFMPSLYFGGSFNPVHHGHLRCAEAVAAQAGYDRVVLIPSARPPHKPNSPDLAPAADRLAMCRLAITERARASSASPVFEVSDIETRRSGPSYTIDTVAELRAAGEREVSWLIGADMLMHLPHWHRPLDLLRDAHFVITARPGWGIDWSALPPEYRHLKDRVVPAPLLDISSTEVRHRVRQNLPIDHLVPPSVARYIEERQLYRG